MVNTSFYNTSTVDKPAVTDGYKHSVTVVWQLYQYFAQKIWGVYLHQYICTIGVGGVDSRLSMLCRQTRLFLGLQQAKQAFHALPLTGSQ